MPNDSFVPWPWSRKEIDQAFVGRACRYVQEGDPITLELMMGRLTILHDGQHRIVKMSIEPNSGPSLFPLPGADLNRVFKGRPCRYVKNGDSVTQDIVPGRVTIWHENNRIVQMEFDDKLPEK